jgi:hypothetical protein
VPELRDLDQAERWFSHGLGLLAETDLRARDNYLTTGPGGASKARGLASFSNFSDDLGDREPG